MTIQFLLLAWRAYRRARDTGRAQYIAVVTEHGMPEASLLVGVGREAWRISEVAIAAWGDDLRIHSGARK